MRDPEHLALIEQRCEDFADHERMTLPRVIRWFGQFAPEHQHLAARVLDAIDYYPTSRIRGMTRDLVRLVMQSLEDYHQDRIFFVPVGGVYESSRVIARALRDEKRDQGALWTICSMSDIEDLEPGDVDAILLVDDFSGTAGSLLEWWEEIEPLILPKQAVVGISLLVVNHIARRSILQFADLLFAVNELDETHNSLSAASRFFDSEELRYLLNEYCIQTGATNNFVHGYGQCGLLVAFRHGCPNNSLPILWWDSEQWHPLFQRYGL